MACGHAAFQLLKLQSITINRHHNEKARHQFENMDTVIFHTKHMYVTNIHNQLLQIIYQLQMKSVKLKNTHTNT